MKKNPHLKEKSKTLSEKKGFGSFRRNSIGEWSLWPNKSKEQSVSSLKKDLEFIEKSGSSLKPLSKSQSFSFVSSNPLSPRHLHIPNYLGIHDNPKRKLKLILSIIKILLSDLGLDPECAGLLLQQIESLTPADSSQNILQLVERTSFRKIAKLMKDFVENESKLRKLVKAQAIVRGWMARKKLPEHKITKEQRLFNQTYFDLVVLERKYLRSLEIVTSQYLEPLNKSLIESKPILPQNELVTNF